MREETSYMLSLLLDKGKTRERENLGQWDVENGGPQRGDSVLQGWVGSK